MIRLLRALKEYKTVHKASLFMITFNTFMKLRNTTKIKKVRTTNRIKLKNTSISDASAEFIQLYQNLNVSKDPISNLRTHEPLIAILDHVSPLFGLEYLEICRQYVDNKTLSHQINILKKIDKVGNPRRYYFKKYGLISPTLIRYLKVYNDLSRIFGRLDNFTISEIGVGFGGQAAILTNLSNPEKYNLYDLPEVNFVARRFLERSTEYSEFEFYDGRKPVEINSDLVVSNYAFSELRRDLQIQYLVNVIIPAKKGYITWNNLSEKQLDGLQIEELRDYIPNMVIEPENPLTSPNNLLIYWSNA